MGKHNKNENSINLVVKIDFIVILLAGWGAAMKYLPQTSHLTQLAIGIGCCVLFYVINKIKIIRRIVQSTFAFLWAGFIWHFLPLEALAEDNALWPWLLLFILFMIFLPIHIRPFEKLNPSSSNYYTNADIGVPSYSYVTDIPVNSMDTELYSRIRAKYEKLVQNFTDTLPLYQECRQKYYGVSIQIDEMFNYMESSIESNRQSLNQIKTVLEMGNHEKQVLLEIWENLNILENFILQIKELCDMLQKTDYENQHQFVHNETTEDTSNMDMFFAGCNDKESVTKRYRQLMKTFHPDNQNGDQKMTQLIQEAYEKQLSMM